MARDEVKINVRPNKVGNEPEALEKQFDKLKNTKLQVEIDAKKNKIDAIEQQIEEIKQDIEVEMTFGVDDSKIEELRAQVEALKQEKATLEVAVEEGELLQAKEIEKSLSGEAEFKVNVLQEIADSSDFMNMSQGFTQARQGVNDLKSGMEEVQQAGLQSEQNLAFLAKNYNNDFGKARATMDQINGIVKEMPGDDNTMRSVLTTAQALGNNLNPEEMKAATNTMADYMQGSATMGKQAIESQQDIMKYLLDGNTAELERGSIVSAHVDKLKEATTFQERQAAMQEVLNELGYGGIAGMDTTINKQAEWEGMMYNAQDKLSSLWLGLEKSAMSYIIEQDEAHGGLLAMGMVAAQMAGGPLIDIALGLGQIGTGMDGLIRGFDILKGSRIGGFFGNLKTKIIESASAIKTHFINALSSAKAFISESLIPRLTSLASTIKTSVVGAFRSLATFMQTQLLPALKNAALGLIETGKSALISGYNALKSAAMWTYEKLAKIASTIASYGLAAAQQVLNFVMSLNPIVLVVLALVALAAALVWAYQNVDWFREGVDSLFAFLQSGATNVFNQIVSGIYWIVDVIISTLQMVWNYIYTVGGLIPANVSITGNQIIDTILRVMAFIITLPMQIGIVFTNIIAKALGFGDNFFQNMVNGATNAVSGFISKIQELPGMIQAEFARIESLVSDFVTSLPQRVWDLGASIIGALKSALGIGSPGHMFYMIEGEFNRIDNLTEKTKFDTGKIGRDMVNDFNPSFNMANGNIGASTNNITINIGSVDDKKRIKEIVDAVEEALKFDNKTAGRSV